MSNIFRCLIISDLHALAGKSKHDDDSYLAFVNGKSTFAQEFLKFIELFNNKIDCLICAGDICNKAEKSAFENGWSFLIDIKNQINAKDFLCVPGNHDYDSMKKESIDPKIYLQFLKPDFPMNDFKINTNFWAWHWCHYSSPNFNALLVDTSAYQGFDKKEMKHGRIERQTSDQILTFVKSEDFTERPLNIILLHHHPYPIYKITGEEDEELITGGEYLVGQLSECVKGPWMIIHGHRHIPTLMYSTSGSSCPAVVFSAGSLSAKLSSDYKHFSANQFYIFDIDLDKGKSKGVPTGIFSTYEYIYGIGWQLTDGSRFPARGGFGSDKTPFQVVQIVVQRLEENSVLRGDDLQDIVSELKYFTPEDMKIFEKELEKNKIRIVKGEYYIEEIIGGQK